MLPYVEQQSLNNFGLTDPNGNTWVPNVPGVAPDGTPTNSTRKQLIKPYQCPSDFSMINGAPINASPPNHSPGIWGMGSSYSANQRLFGTVRTGTAVYHGYGSQYKIGNIPDGTSNTIAFTEAYASCGYTWENNLWAFPAQDSGWNQYPVIANTWMDGYPDSPKPAGQGAGWWDDLPQFHPTLAKCNKLQSQGIHTSTIMVSLADGSVRGVHQGISYTTWNYAINPADGLPLGSDW